MINLDARGNSGPSIMFETSDDNGWLIRQYAQAVPHPLATSASMDVYRELPNGTDLTIFKQAGMAGLNFAFSAGLAYYHTSEDTPENLDPRTLQHQGENALAMARWLGQLDLDAPKHSDLIYTSILSHFVLSYPMSWALPLALATALLFLGVITIGVQTRQLPLSDVAAGATVLFLAICAALVVLALLFLIGFIWNILSLQFHGTRVSWLKFDVPILTGCAMLTATLTLVLKRWCASARSFVALSLGALSWWLVLTLATAWWLPGCSYLFVWPTLFGVLGLGVSLAAQIGTTATRVITLLCTTPALMLFPPLFRNMFDGLSLELAAPGMILVVLFLGTMLPVLEPLFAPKPTWRQFPIASQARASSTNP